ncbi:polysaccharide deacetylase family protein [Nocardiopsis coralliicola]
MIRYRSTTARRTALGAAAVALALSACSPGGGEHASGTEESPPEKPAGPADAITEVDPATVPGLGEETDSDDGDVSIDVAYPKVPGADPFTERLKDVTGTEADDFVDANPGAKSLSIKGALSAAGGDVLGVRFVQDEEDSEGKRTSYSTYWYDAKEGRPAYASELLAGDAELAELHKAVAKQLDEDGVETGDLYPIARMYDSLGFTPGGDLVAEFDDGQLSGGEDGEPVRAVVPRKEAEPLLSEFGERALSASTQVTRDFRLEGAAAPKDGGKPAAVPGQPGAEDVDCSGEKAKCLALTFDDGPGGRTGDVLDAFAEHDAHATFFVTGEPVREHPTTVRRAYAEGHEIANHTESHPDLTTLDKGGVEEELAPVSSLVARETGARPTLMRPPYGATDGTVADVTADLGMSQIIWDVDTNDWRDRSAGTVADRAVEGAAPGGIILMHDIHDTTVDAVPDILDRLDKEGYTLVTVSALLGETKPGKEYKSAEDARPEASASPSPSASPED